MVTTISKKTRRKRIKEILETVNSKGKYLKASKYSGKLKLKQKPLTIQKKLRNEWN